MNMLVALNYWIYSDTRENELLTEGKQEYHRNEKSSPVDHTVITMTIH